MIHFSLRLALNLISKVYSIIPIVLISHWQKRKTLMLKGSKMRLRTFRIWPQLFLDKVEVPTLVEKLVHQNLRLRRAILPLDSIKIKPLPLKINSSNNRRSYHRKKTPSSWILQIPTINKIRYPKLQCISTLPRLFTKPP